MTTSNSQESKPAIVEALSEIHFRPSVNWDATFFGSFYDRVKFEFPLHEHREWGDFGPPRASEGLRRARKLNFRMLFRKADNSALLQFGEDFLALNVFPPYQGWENLKASVVERIHDYVEVTGEKEVERLAVRFIYVLDAENGAMRLDQIIHPGSYVPEPLRASTQRFFLNVSQNEDKGGMLGLAVTFQPDMESNRNSLVLDIDHGLNVGGAVSASDLNRLLDQSHQGIIRVLDGLIVEQARIVLEV